MKRSPVVRTHPAMHSSLRRIRSKAALDLTDEQPFDVVWYTADTDGDGVLNTGTWWCGWGWKHRMRTKPGWRK